MPIIRPVHNIYPVMGNNCFLADTAVLVGDVIMGDDCSVWWGAVVRGDVNSIRIGDRVNIQDGAVIHALSQLKIAAQAGGNIMEPSIQCAKAGVTTGEWADALRQKGRMVGGEKLAAGGVRHIRV